MLKQQSALRYSHLLLNAIRTEWRRGVLIFANTHHKSVTIETSLEQAVAIGIFYYEVDLSLSISWKFGEDECRHSGDNMWKRVYFGYVCSHPPTMQMSNKISGFIGSRFTNFCMRRRGIIADVNAIIGVATFPFVLRCQHKPKRWG